MSLEELKLKLREIDWMEVARVLPQAVAAIMLIAADLIALASLVREGIFAFLSLNLMFLGMAHFSVLAMRYFDTEWANPKAMPLAAALTILAASLIFF